MTAEITDQIRIRLRQAERPKKDSVGALAEALYDDISAKRAEKWPWKEIVGCFHDLREVHWNALRQAHEKIKARRIAGAATPRPARTAASPVRRGISASNTTEAPTERTAARAAGGPAVKTRIDTRPEPIQSQLLLTIERDSLALQGKAAPLGGDAGEIPPPTQN